MKQKRTIRIVILFVTITLGSCKNFLQIEPPKTQAELSRIFEDDQTANSAAVGLYSQMVSNYFTFCNGGITIYTGLSADEIVNLNPSSNDDPFKNNNIVAGSSIIASTFWSDPYKNIYQANAVLEGLNRSTKLSPPVKRQLQGEMLYIRALHYFYLVNLFGDIPLETTTDYTINGVMPRTESRKVYEQIIADLVESRVLLSDSYPTAVSTRPNKDGATAMLARVYLFQQRWADAKTMASEVINSRKYHLEDLNKVFLSTSKEVIFQLMKPNSNTAEGSIFIPYSNTVEPTYAITSHLLNAFETGDNRKSVWLQNNLVHNQSYYYPNKYKVSYSSIVTEFYVVQRLAELYLIRAEAKAQLEDISGAIDDIDLIRNRAGVFSIKTINPGINKIDLLNAILKERQTELFAEWGHRWFDLKRTGKADQVLNVIKSPNWQPTDQQYPIPFPELQVNPFLHQNAGYLN